MGNCLEEAVADLVF